MTANQHERRVRLGAGAGYSGDRIEPAVELAEHGQLDFLVFECLAERTIAIAQQAKRKDPQLGYDPLLEARMRAVLPVAARNGVRIISNMGAANPHAAARKTAQIAQSLGLGGLKLRAEHVELPCRRHARCLRADVHEPVRDRRAVDDLSKARG